MKRTRQFVFLLAFVAQGFFAETVQATASKACLYGKTNQCAKDEFCINVGKGKTECQKNFKRPLIKVEFPFAAAVSARCDQGPLSPPSNSHTWLNTAFALDLQSDRKLKDVSVFAGIRGIAIVSDGCTSENDQCGLGFGNAVKILTDDGYLIFYAHLKKTLIKTGDEVKPGDRIGIEGTTGWTGEGNRHLHLSVHYDWRPAGYEYWKQTGYLPASVPYKLNFCDECSKQCKSSEADIRNMSCARTSKTTKPICKSK